LNVFLKISQKNFHSHYKNFFSPQNQMHFSKKFLQEFEIDFFMIFHQKKFSKILIIRKKNKLKTNFSFSRLNEGKPL